MHLVNLDLTEVFDRAGLLNMLPKLVLIVPAANLPFSFFAQCTDALAEKEIPLDTHRDSLLNGGTFESKDLL